MSKRLSLKKLAALAECIEAVDMDRVDHYRQALQTGEVDPIVVCDVNPQGFYVIHDGNHRTLAYILEGREEILAEIDPNVHVSNISWRWPRIAPISHTLELLSYVTR